MDDSKLMNTNDNRDPLSGEPGAHPVGAGVGAAIGGIAAGAVTGSVAGPVGTVVGAAVGAMMGGLLGKGVAETLEPTREAAWQREGVLPQTEADRAEAAQPADFAPAYAFALNACKRFEGRFFEEVEPELEHDWKALYGDRGLPWEQARGAIREAWERAGTPRAVL